MTEAADTGGSVPTASVFAPGARRGPVIQRKKKDFFRNEQFLSASDVRNLFNYEPSGALVRRVTVAYHAEVGDRVGYRRGEGHGYLAVCINHRVYAVHRVIWLHQTGKWPKDRLDHINGDTLDNRIENLREASQQQNRYNSARPRTATNPYKGVYQHSKNRFRATIRKDGRQVHLGNFLTAEDARAARLRVEQEIYGSFSFENRSEVGVGAPLQEPSRLVPREVGRS